MRRVSIFLLLATLAWSLPASAATMREIKASELRKIVSAGQTMSVKRAIASAVKATGGEPVEVRAFQADDVFYRIVLKAADGSLVSYIVNASTGDRVAKGSAVERQVSAASKAGSAGKNKAKDNTGNSRAAGAGGSGNANGGSGNSSGGGNSGGGGGGGNGGGGGGGNGGGKN